MLNHLYYYLKPTIPRSLQLTVRRKLALYKRRRYCGIWPIDPSAGRTPEGWTGWPEGKRFALALSHDVDTIHGAKKTLDLAALEQDMGFRSSFNFVSERYNNSSRIRTYLNENGFEIAVHGLVHDGKLFWSKEIFEKRSVRINHYLQKWGAVGFHSPSMHRNLEWTHDLNIEYDQSTFDTDPFEPEPEGVRTIFPFAVYKNSLQAGSADGHPDSLRPDRLDRPNRLNGLDRPNDPIDSTHPKDPINPINPMDPTNSRSFYVELPYTLPQDHALFVILRERDISVWKEKLDWIVEKGGMALLNTHPDYMNFNGRSLEREEYRAKFYAEFLEYVQEKYQGQYWHVLPREIARFWRKTMVPAP